MWECPKCSERLENAFDTCWNCGTSSDGIEDPAFRRAERIFGEPGEIETTIDQPSREQSHAAIGSDGVGKPGGNRCRDCGVVVTFLGRISFVKRSDSKLARFLAAFTERDAADLEAFPISVFRCPNCRRLELYDLDD